MATRVSRLRCRALVSPRANVQVDTQLAGLGEGDAKRCQGLVLGRWLTLISIRLQRAGANGSRATSPGRVGLSRTACLSQTFADIKSLTVRLCPPKHA